MSKKSLDSGKKSGCTYCGGNSHVKFTTFLGIYVDIPCRHCNSWWPYNGYDEGQAERERSKALVKLAESFVEQFSQGYGYYFLQSHYAKLKKALAKYKVKG